MNHTSGVFEAHVLPTEEAFLGNLPAVGSPSEESLPAPPFPRHPPREGAGWQQNGCAGTASWGQPPSSTHLGWFLITLSQIQSQSHLSPCPAPWALCALAYCKPLLSHRPKPLSGFPMHVEGWWAASPVQSHV